MQAIMRLRGTLHTQRSEEYPTTEKNTPKRTHKKLEAYDTSKTSSPEDAKEVFAGSKRKRQVS
jgi:hypothetical protein